MTHSLFSGLPAVFMASASAMLIAWLAIPTVVKIASARNLNDPPGFRKVHSRTIPILGGVAIFAGFSFGFLFTINDNMHGMNFLTIAAILLFFTGMKDDLISIDPKKRLAVEIFAAVLLVMFTDIRITSFHGFLGIHDIPMWLTGLTTIFLMIVIINAFNLIDGIDGLAATTGIIASVTFGIWFWKSADFEYTLMAASLTGALVSFLRFNISNGKNKIFMGDSGSLLTGYILAVMAIRFNEINAGSAPLYNLHSSPAVAIAILIVPLFDTLRVFTIRVIHGHHPFTADNRHIHHLLLRAGFSHKRSTLYIALAHILIIILAFRLDHTAILILTFILLALCLFLTGIIYFLIYKNNNLKKVPVKEEDAGMIRMIMLAIRYFTGEKTPVPDLAPSVSKKGILHVHSNDSHTTYFYQPLKNLNNSSGNPLSRKISPQNTKERFSE